jgi:hypothetical protein
MEKWISDRISTFTDKAYTSIIIFPKRKRWKEALLFAWTLGFTFVGVYLIYVLFFDMNSINNSQTQLEGNPVEVLRQQKIYLTIFIAFWVYFEFKVVKGLLWVVLGKEMIKIDSDAIFIKNSILSYGKSNRYFHENIKKMELIEHKEFSFGFDYENAFWRKGTDSIIFDHKTKPISFGRKLDAQTARLLLRFISDRQKKLVKKS